MSGRVRVLLWHRATNGDRAALEAAYHAISRDLAGTPGLLGNELLHAPDDPERLVVASEWESLDAFRNWEQGATHRSTTAPLRTFRDTSRDRPYEILEVIATH